MKKVVSLMMVMLLCLCLFGCGKDNGGGSGGGEASVSDKVRKAVDAQVRATVAIRYDTVGAADVTCYVEEVGENEFEASGKVTVKDKYGDTYTGKYDAEATYNPETGKCRVTSCEVDKLYKN